MPLIHNLTRTLEGLHELFKGPVHSYCRLETADNPTTLVADDGSLLSAYKLEGTLTSSSEDDFDRVLDILTERIKPLFEAKSGHSLQLVFEYDPCGGYILARENFLAARASARAMGLSLDPLIDGLEDILGGHLSAESTWLVIFTRPFALEGQPLALALKETERAMATLKCPPGCQNTQRAVAALREIHKSAVITLGRALEAAGLLGYLMEVHDLVKDIRQRVDPHFTPRDYQPLLPGDRLPLVYPDGDKNPLSLAGLPALPSQIFPREGEVVERSFVKIGEMIYAPMFLKLPPMNPKPFAELFEALAARKQRLPLRLSLTLSPDGLRGLSLKSVLAQILALSSRENRQLYGSINYLKKLATLGQSIVGLSFEALTWVDVLRYKDRPQALRDLKARQSELANLLSGWGLGSCETVTGDPLLGLCATVPGLFPEGGPAPRAATDLLTALSFMPLRPASIWTTGSLPFMTVDGKFAPYDPNSSSQAAWIDVAFSPMGGGKSVLLNCMNLAFILKSGQNRLPLISIIDVGPSSSGLIALIKNALPPWQEHLAAYHRLRLSPEYAVNPFDTPLGLRSPLPAQLSFLVNFLCLLCTSLEAKAPPTGVAGILRTAILAAYQELENHPRLFNRLHCPQVSDLLDSLNYPFDEETAWWEIVDFLFERGHLHEAHLAQRFAVPVLPDVSTQIRQHPGLKLTYDFKVPGSGEMVLAYTWRCLTEATAAYPILSTTRFSVGEARIISLDLDEVAPRGGGAAGSRQSAVMYMLARHLVGSRFFLMPADVFLIPEKYKSYHKQQIHQMRQDPKRLCYDEVHRITGEETVASQLVGDLETSARESRKWNLSIGFCSQTYEDFPKVILELATSIFILGSGTEKGRADLVKVFGLNQAMEKALSRLGKPGPRGAELIAIYKIFSGSTQQHLTNIVSPSMLWAFSSTTEDVTVRNALYERFGVEKTLGVLARYWPGGIKSEVERRKALRKEYGQMEGTDVLGELIAELGQLALGHGSGEVFCLQ